MHTRAAFITDRQASKSTQPAQRTLDHSARAARAAAVGRAPLGEFGGDASAVQLIAMPLRVVAAIPLDQARLTNRTAKAALDEWRCVDERQQPRDCVTSLRLAAVGVAMSGVPCASVGT